MRGLVAVGLVLLLTACTGSSTTSSAGPPAASASPAAASIAHPADSASSSDARSEWTTLHWETPALTGPLESLSDAVAWNGGFVAVGQIQTTNGGTEAAAWVSTDWLIWTRTLLDVAASGDSTLLRVVALGSTLEAVGTSGVQRCVPPQGEGQVCDSLPVAVWTSEDGRTWRRAPAPTSLTGVSVADIASNAGRLILVGDTGWDAPGIWTSNDGTSWYREALPAGVFGKAHFLGVAGMHGGFVLTGSTGGSKPVCCVGSPNDSTPAAWSSPDGLDWQAAAVDGAAGARGDSIARVFVGRDGVVAWGGGDASTGWSSPDGRRWSAVPTQDRSYQITPRASDGERIVGDSFVAGGHVAYWVSRDGASWRPLAASGAVDQMPAWDASGGATADAAFLFPTGVGLTGRNGTYRFPLWFATVEAGT